MLPKHVGIRAKENRAQKARWAKRKGVAKATAPVKRRRMSAAGRSRIAAAAKAPLGEARLFWIAFKLVHLLNCLWLESGSTIDRYLDNPDDVKLGHSYWGEI
jgi:hypothetical protein